MPGCLTAWLLAVMVVWQPPVEPADGVRYLAIASDIATIAADPAEAPAFAGSDGRARTALLLAAIAAGESQYRADVDDGTVRGALGEVCIMQVLVTRRTREGWTAEDLVQDRLKCIRSALALVRASLAMCHRLSDGDQLGGYTHGACVSPNALGRSRWSRAFRALRRGPPRAVCSGIPPWAVDDGLEPTAY